MPRVLCRILVTILVVGATLLPPLQSALAHEPLLANVTRFSRYPGAVRARVPPREQSSAVVIDFEDLTPSSDPLDQTTVAEQYASLGVSFNGPTVSDYGAFPGFAHSGTRAVHSCAADDEFCAKPVVMTFSEPQRRVKVWVGYTTSLDEEAVVRLSAFDAPEGGGEVSSEFVTLGPRGARIPVESPLQVMTDSAVIRRVEVEFSPPSISAPRLVVDDVEFEGAPALEACPSDAEPPSIVLQQQTSELEVQENLFTLRGRVNTTEPLAEATLSARSSEGTRSMNLLNEAIAPSGGEFGPVRIKDLLPRGTNTITLTARNCVGEGAASASITYAPIDVGTRYEVLGIEVTQTIQDINNSAPLIAGKRAFVRVYLRTTGPTELVRSVSARLRGCQVPVDGDPDCLGGAAEFAPLSSSKLKPIVVNGSADWSQKRMFMEESLNFELPLAWTEPGLLHLELDPASLSPNLPCDGCDNRTQHGDARTYLFQEAPALRVKLEDAPYWANDKLQEPTARDRARLKSWLRRAFPTSEVIATELGMVPLDHVPTCQEVNELIYGGEFAALNASGRAAPDSWQRYYGLVATSDERFVAGCFASSDAKPRPYAEQFAAGAAGPPAPESWDDDGSIADYYGAHELAHTYRRLHPGFCSDNGADDPDFTLGTGHISAASPMFYGFDAGDASEANASGDTADKSKNLPRLLYDPNVYNDLMTYCPSRWISAYTYKGLLDGMWEAEDAPASLARLSNAEPGQQVLLALGTIDLDNDTVEMRPFSLLSGELVTIRATASDYSIELQKELPNGQRQRIVEYPFEAREYKDVESSATRIAQLAEVVPWNPETKYIVIQKNGAPIAERAVSNTPPTVTLSQPNGGEVLGDANRLVIWDGDDADPNHEPLTYTLLYSTDGGVTWMNVATGITAEEFEVDPDTLPGSTQALFRVIVSDGVLTGEDDSDASFTVPFKAPEVGIVSPETGTTYGTSQTIELVGTVSDVEQGTLDDAALQWTSDRQGDLGTGTWISVSGLSLGRHTITLTATDEQGETASTSIVLEIVDDDPPTLAWGGSPLDTAFLPDGLFFYDGTEESGAFIANDGAGGIRSQRTFDVLLNGWSAVVAGSFGGDDFSDLLFYNGQLGIGEFYAADGNGGLQLLSANEGFTQGWDIIVPGDFDGQGDWSDLFFYERGEGVGKFYRTDGEGRIALLGAPAPLADRWSGIVAGDFGGDARTDLLFYDKSNGLAQLSTADGQGGLMPLNDGADWTAGWDIIVPGNFGGADRLTDLFLYDAETGNATFLTADGSGGFVPLGSLEPFVAPWTTIVSGNFGGDDELTDLYFYDGESGRDGFYATDGAGGLAPLNGTPDVGSGWDLIVPGRFGSP